MCKGLLYNSTFTKVIKSKILVLTATIVILSTSTIYATAFDLSFTGTVDQSEGFTVGGVDAPFGSSFTLDVVLESTATLGTYDISSVGFTTTVGTYETVTDWTVYGNIVAIQNGSDITLDTSPSFIDPGEHFEVGLGDFNTGALFDNPLSWGGSVSITGDIIVRGLGGFGSLDELSGYRAYNGTLSLGVTQDPIPEPATVALLGIGLVGLAGAEVRRRRKKNAVDNS